MLTFVPVANYSRKMHLNTVLARNRSMQAKQPHVQAVRTKMLASRRPKALIQIYH